jgi:hypothetical protein
MGNTVCCRAEDDADLHKSPPRLLTDRALRLPSVTSAEAICVNSSASSGLPDLPPPTIRPILRRKNSQSPRSVVWVALPRPPPISLALNVNVPNQNCAPGNASPHVVQGEMSGLGQLLKNAPPPVGSAENKRAAVERTEAELHDDGGSESNGSMRSSLHRLFGRQSLLALVTGGQSVLDSSVSPTFHISSLIPPDLSPPMSEGE